LAPTAMGRPRGGWNSLKGAGVGLAADAPRGDKDRCSGGFDGADMA